jgi:hypothetical protein
MPAKIVQKKWGLLAIFGLFTVEKEPLAVFSHAASARAPSLLPNPSEAGLRNAIYLGKRCSGSLGVPWGIFLGLNQIPAVL